MTGRSDGVNLTAEKLARVLMITERRVQQLAQEGVLVKEGRGRYPFIPNVQAYIKYWQDRAVGSREMGEIPDYHAEKARLVKAQADKAELEAAKLRGELLEAEKVEALWGKVANNIRQAMLALPTKIAPVAHAAKDKVEAESILRDAIFDVLTELADSEIPEAGEIGDEPAAATS